MERTDGRAAVREAIRTSGGSVWRDNRPPLEGEVM